MDAVTYIKEAMRMCKSSGDYCEHCSAKIEKFCPISLCRTARKDMHGNEEKAVSIVEQWAKDHPVKTRQSEFLKMFPHANINSFTDTFCVAHFDKTKTCKASAPTDEMCEKCRDAYWNEEVSE